MPSTHRNVSHSSTCALRVSHTARKVTTEALRLIAIAVLLVSTVRPAAANVIGREHTVIKGQTLSRIASRYGVSMAALAAANNLAQSSSLRPGQVLLVPDRGVVFAAPGDTLASIARRHDCSAADLAQQNHMTAQSSLRVGQRLTLPGQESARAQNAAEKRWGAPKRAGMVTLFRIATQEHQRLRLVDDRGRVRRPALQVLTRFLRPRTARRGKEPHPRLIRLLAQVSDHFGGRLVQVISGYRKPGGYTKDTSRHVAGQAIDFRIPGVELTELRDYCSKLDHVGVGYYPRSQFVHLDVRVTAARWTDYSGPGQAPQFARKGEPPPLDLEGEPAAEDDGKAPVDEQPDAITNE
jgi:uncharacterized protein YcbK (DUF882 family)